MGITGELVRSVFSKNRSFGSHGTTNVMRNNAVARKRWALVRSYLCGDEFKSVLAEEDSASVRSSKATFSSVFVEESARTSKATVFSSVIGDEDSTSVKSSEATVTQPMLQDFTEHGETQSKVEKDQNTNSTSRLLCEQEAALVIQSAFRSFLARRRNGRLGLIRNSEQELVLAAGSPSKESIATSIEVQTGNSVVEVFSSVQEETVAVTHRTPHNKGAKAAQASKLKEDWDDSTVSSNISKMRIQNRLAASTRRERALAYAFSQQLRICSKKKQDSRSGNGSEANMSWSWLERWMATRQQDSSFGDISKQLEQLNSNQKLMVKKRLLSDLAGEEKESCGSNEVSMHFDNVSLSSPTAEKEYYKPTRNRLKPTSASRRKNAPSYHFSKENPKVNKKDCKEGLGEKKQRAKQGGVSKREIKSEDDDDDDDDATSHVSPDHILS